jgi:hypothetical protein
MKFLLFIINFITVSSYLRKEQKEISDVCTNIDNNCIVKEQINIEPKIYFNTSYDCQNGDCISLSNNNIIINNTLFHIDNCYMKYEHINCVITNNSI